MCVCMNVGLGFEETGQVIEIKEVMYSLRKEQKIIKALNREEIMTEKVGHRGGELE